MEINMKSFFESLLRLYEFDGPSTVVATPKALESLDKRLLDLPTKDASTFPFLP
jgi:hypothetical protein